MTLAFILNIYHVKTLQRNIKLLVIPNIFGLFSFLDVKPKTINNSTENCH